MDNKKQDQKDKTPDHEILDEILRWDDEGPLPIPKKEKSKEREKKE